jgi:hypothetical protein
VTQTKHEKPVKGYGANYQDAERLIYLKFEEMQQAYPGPRAFAILETIKSLKGFDFPRHFPGMTHAQEIRKIIEDRNDKVKQLIKTTAS